MREKAAFMILAIGVLFVGGGIYRIFAGPPTSRDERAWLKKMEPFIASYGEPPEYNKWDGSYKPVKRYLREAANDPSSIEFDGCTEVEVTSEGWLVGCEYRGANVFGGTVGKTNWFTIQNDRVVQVHDYKPASSPTGLSR